MGTRFQGSLQGLGLDPTMREGRKGVRDSESRSRWGTVVPEAVGTCPLNSPSSHPPCNVCYVEEQRLITKINM